MLPGFGQVRELELLVKAGFTPLEAIRIGTLEGARFLGQDGAGMGSMAPGKRANLMMVPAIPTPAWGPGERRDGLPGGVAYDSRALRDSVRGVVGLR